MKESVAIAKDADAIKEFLPTNKSIHRVRNEPERQLNSLRSVIGNIRHYGGTPSVDSIATELSSMHAAQRASALLALQRTHGNRYVQRVVAGIQAKLKVEQPGDIYEQEADRVAEEVVRMKLAWTLRNVEQQIQHSAMDHGNMEEEISQELLRRIESQQGSGQPLNTQIRTEMEGAFGYDFGKIRLHMDSEAQKTATALGARAFTFGRDIWFGCGESSSDKKLLAHELTHTIQQCGAKTVQQAIMRNGLTPTVSTHSPQIARFARGKEEKEEPKAEKEEEEKKRLEAILKKVDEMISLARKLGYKYAAENLEYWRSMKGGIKMMPASVFKNQKFIIKWLKGTPRTKFLIGAEKRLKSGELVSGDTVHMYWIDSLMAPKGNELFYALGGFTIRSDVIVKATEFSPEKGGGFLVSFVKWTCKATDDYNWDKLKYTVIPLFGKISDDDMRLLEKYGYGKSFKIESGTWVVTDSQCLQEVAISP